MSQNPLAELESLPISSWKYPRVLLGIPLERTISYASDVFFPFADIFAQGPTYLKSSFNVRIDVTRNLMARELLNTTFTHLLMLDIDHIHPKDIIQRLSRWPALYGDDVPVVCGMNFRRQPPYDPIMGNLVIGTTRRPIITEWDSGLIQFDECGAASLLVSRKVFETIPFPWFRNVYDYEFVAKNKWPGEDIYFARKCKEYGFPFYVDTTTTSPHITTTAVTEETFRNYLADHPEEFSDEIED